LLTQPLTQPQSAADLIGAAFSLYRKHVPFIFKILVGPTVAAALASLALQWAVNYALVGGSNKPSAIALVVLVILGAFAAVLAAKWILTIRQLALVRHANGFAREFPEADRYMWSRRWAVLGILLLAIVVIVAVTIAWTIELSLAVWIARAGQAGTALSVVGILFGALGLCLTLGYAVVLLYMVLSVLACEESPLSIIISRATRLTFRDSARALGFGALLIITISAMSYPLSLPIVAITAFDVVKHGLTAGSLSESYKLPFYLMVLNQTWESLVNLLLWPVTYLAYGFFYQDLRLRQEGLDLVRQLEALPGADRLANG